MTAMNAQRVVDLLKKEQGEGTRLALAGRIGISAQYLSDVFTGNRQPGKKILRFFGIERETVYRKRRK